MVEWLGEYPWWCCFSYLSLASLAVCCCLSRFVSFSYFIAQNNFFRIFLWLSQTKTRHSSYDRIDIWFVFLSECFSLARRATWLVGFNTYNTNRWLYFWRNGMGKKWMIIECLAVFEHNNKKTSFKRFNFQAQQRFSFILALRGSIAHQKSSTGTD